MKLKNSYFYTIRENAKDEDSTSGNLLVRSGMIKKSSTGVYMYLPLGYKVLKNIENIIREEMNNIKCQELLMPSLIQEDIYIASGRRDSFGKNMFTLKDRFDKNYVLGPTHEELFAMAGNLKVRSYKDLPFSLYQFQTKFRDETRPRYGLIRVREFIMKDAYTFDTDYEGLNKSYSEVYNAYKTIFARLGIDYRVVTADTGAMGGLLSEEFQAVTDIGEDVLVLCSKCDYASNIEVAECIDNKLINNIQRLDKTLIETPNVRTIEEVSKFFNHDKNNFVKTLLYKVDNKPVACLIRGDRELNEIKLSKLLKATNIEMLDQESVEKITGAEVGFAGPININIPIIMDNEVQYMNNFIIGANKTNYHYDNANVTDFKYDLVSDIRNVTEYDVCPKCGKPLMFKKGIEVGNTFKLGTKYSEALDLNYLDANNETHPVVMGSHGIGIGRCMAALVEQSNDEKGIIWPLSIAPYKVSIVVIDINDEKQMSTANKLYDKLMEIGVEPILDDRDERPGVKFNDMDLIGIPIRITIGKKVNDNIVEFKKRKDNINLDIELTSIMQLIKENI
jgi:prolyl-tRNA synthetase